jgi:hypothetical protein
MKFVFQFPEQNKSACIYSYRNEVFSISSLDSALVGTMSGKWWEIPRDLLTLGNTLGSGAFGMVKKGQLEMEKESMTCAVKMLKSE